VPVPVPPPPPTPPTPPGRSRVLLLLAWQPARSIGSGQRMRRRSGIASLTAQVRVAARCAALGTSELSLRLRFADVCALSSARPGLA
jgi:hypothetical protein